MKKPLSKVAGSILVTSTSTTAACKPKDTEKQSPTTESKSKETSVISTKFDLNNIHVTNIKVTNNATSRKLQINVENAFKKIVTKIIERYQGFGFKDENNNNSMISVQDFRYGSTTDDTHPWAIQIIDGNGVAMTKPDDVIEMNNIFSTAAPTKVLLPDNALEVKIVTTNTNVKTASATAHAYLDKFVYSKTNINQGLVINYNVVTSIDNLKKVIDVSDVLNRFRYRYTTISPADEIIRGFQQLTKTIRTEISKKVLTALNTQLQTETKTLNNLGFLQPTTTETIVFNNSKLRLYKMHEDSILPMRDKNTAENGDQLYIRILNLGLNSYIHAANAYLYLKIATVQQG